MMMGLNPCLSVGLKTYHSSGLTAPWTTFSPRPQAPVRNTASRKPVSVSMENMTPLAERSERTIFCTAMDRAMEKWSKPLSWR